MRDIEIKTKELIDALKATCHACGLGNGGDEYKVIVQIFLYKYLNDKFAYELQQMQFYKNKLKTYTLEMGWDEVYDRFSEEDCKEVFSYLDANTPKIKPHQTVTHLFNASNREDINSLLDETFLEIAKENADIFSLKTSRNTQISIFSAITQFLPDESKRASFAKALISNLVNFSFEEAFHEKFDFFSTIFEYLIADYNANGGGVYAEYYTPRSIAAVMAKLLVPENSNLNSVTCYDPSAGSGTLLMALAHAIGEDRCTIYSQDISQKSSQMLRLNLILNNLVASLPNIIEGNTLLDPYHKDTHGNYQTFDFVISNPPFKLDFSEDRDKLDADKVRFWAGVPKVPEKKKESMAIYTCFFQHVINSMNDSGKGAIVVPTGFITAKSGVENRILQRLVDDKIVVGVISMPSNIFANTGTNVSVVFMDKSRKQDTVCLIDASKLGKKIKDKNLQRTILEEKDINLIIDTFKNRETVEDFSVNVAYEEIKEKGYSLSAGQYFDIKIDYVDISEKEFNAKMQAHQEELQKMFAESKKLEDEILSSLSKLIFKG